MENATGYIHSIESAGTLDGPGIRRVLFLQGCPLSCLYCHNPDSRSFRCGRCTDAWTELRAIAANRDFLLRTGGGVTISGGEPLSQPGFVKIILKGCKALGIHTALDTSGFPGHRADDELLANTDLVLLDIKHMNPDVYRTLTGVDLQPTLDFARRLSGLGKPIWLRYVLVPGYTDDMSAIGELATFACKLGNVERVEVLPYHSMGAWKWEQLGAQYPLKHINEPTNDQVEYARMPFRKAGLTVY
jgi:pyruvate formate lyase activating enzyme